MNMFFNLMITFFFLGASVLCLWFLAVVLVQQWRAVRMFHRIQYPERWSWADRWWEKEGFKTNPLHPAGRQGWFFIDKNGKTSQDLFQTALDARTALYLHLLECWDVKKEPL